MWMQEQFGAALHDMHDMGDMNDLNIDMDDVRALTCLWFVK
jgi:hypothetical protein